MMATTLTAICYFCLLSLPEAFGLELSWNVHSAKAFEHRNVCGVLICEEIIDPEAPNGTARNSRSDLSISSISIFKSVETTSANRKEILVESLTSTQPTVTRVSNGIRVVGFLDSKRARLRLEMVKNTDCSAQYSCKLRSSDNKGSEHVQTNRIQQRPEHNNNQRTEGPMVAGMFLQQLVLLQQQVAFFGTTLEGKFGTLNNRFETLDDKIGALSGSFDGLKIKLEDLNKKVENAEVRAKSAQDRLEDKLQRMEDQLQNKIESRVIDKLCQIEAKLSSDSRNYDDISRYLVKIEDSLTILKRESKSNLEKSYMMIAATISNNTNKITDAVQRQATESLTGEHKSHITLNDMMIATSKLLNTSENFSARFENNLHVLSSNFEQLQVGFHNSTTKTLSLVSNMMTDTNKIVLDSLKPVMVDMLSPKVCTKGMFPSLLGTAFPYHVIHPDADDQVAVPYLCDSASEGGGWIVIQRRSSGGTLFFRNWEEYAKGFGSLYGDFWWGNRNIHALTSGGQYELRVSLKYKGKSVFAHYDSFSLGGEDKNFILWLGAYHGTAGDSLSFHSGKQFSTYDRDHDGRSQNDAALYTAAWWYYHGYHSNLNGVWAANGNTKAMRWNTLTGTDSVSFSEMKIRKL